MKFTSEISRRDFLKGSLTALATPLFMGCLGNPTEPDRGHPRLTARPGTPTVPPTLGLTELGLGSGRDGALYIPETYTPNIAMPLFIGLHGAGGHSSNWLSYHARAETRGMIFLAPDSRLATWDLIRGSYGADVEFLDQALNHVFERCNVDPTRIALAGFSDGATYALSLGISNGDLFTHLIGYSPGFVESTDPIVGRPKVYISHGSLDGILPVQASRHNIVPSLVNSGYDVTYNEFVGGHEVPAEVTEDALDWFMGVEEEPQPQY